MVFGELNPSGTYTTEQRKLMETCVVCSALPGRLPNHDLIDLICRLYEDVSLLANWLSVHVDDRPDYIETVISQFKIKDVVF